MDDQPMPPADDSLDDTSPPSSDFEDLPLGEDLLPEVDNEENEEFHSLLEEALAEEEPEGEAPVETSPEKESSEATLPETE
jgi:hypothetical protein